MASVVARWLVVILSEEKDLSGEILRRLSLLRMTFKVLL
jgi:hypothetical protein